MEAYLDNSATTKVFESVKDIVVKTMTEDFGNPSSLHKKGVEAEGYVKAAAESVAKTLKAAPSEIIFTSGGTESNNMAIIGAARANKRAGRHFHHRAPFRLQCVWLSGGGRGVLGGLYSCG